MCRRTEEELRREQQELRNEALRVYDYNRQWLSERDSFNAALCRVRISETTLRRAIREREELGGMGAGKTPRKNNLKSVGK